MRHARPRNHAIPLVLLAAIACAGCHRDEPVEPVNEPAPRASVDLPVFEECATTHGLDFVMKFLPSEQGENFKTNLYDHGCGVAIADYDSDGWDDIYLTNQLGPNALFRNDGSGSFANVTATTGADLALANRICVGATFGDYDNDGRPDLFVTSTRGGNALFHNEGDGKFADVTEAAGVALVAHSETGTFFDADLDGDLDLFLTNTAQWTTDTRDESQHYYLGPGDLRSVIAGDREMNVYYRNDGGGKFSDATAESGLAGEGWGGDCAVFDHDSDGAPDLFVSNMFGTSHLYKNDGHGHFTDVRKAALGRVSFGALGTRAFDYDVDGRLDLLVVDMHSDMWIPTGPGDPTTLIEEKKKYKFFLGPMLTTGTPYDQEQQFADLLGINYREVIFGNTLYRNLGGGKFEEVSDAAGVETFQPWSATPADFRNAGVEDVLICAGMGSPYFYWPNSYLLNRGDGTFVESAKEAGFDPPPGGIHLDLVLRGKPAVKSSRSAATADFDHDGRVDVVLNNFNERAYLYMNRTPPRNWFELKLTGSKSNRDAVGALVTVVAGGKTRVRLVQAAGGYLSQSSSTLHFGLGAATSIESCEILWPSGAKQALDHAAVNTLHLVTEPAG